MLLAWRAPRSRDVRIMWLPTQRPEDDLAFKATFIFHSGAIFHAAFGEGRLGATDRMLVPVWWIRRLGRSFKGLTETKKTRRLEFIFAWLTCFVYGQGVNFTSMIPLNGRSAFWATCLSDRSHQLNAVSNYLRTQT